MLRQISVRDFAIIDYLEVDFERAMTALTGETGAGKSILVDVIGLLLGDRAGGSSIRTGAEQAELHALFELETNHPALAWILAQGLQPAAPEENRILLRRTIPRHGKSRAWINSRSVTITQLRELGSMLVDIHGQHAHQQLLQRPAQRALLDGLVDPSLLSTMRSRHLDLQKSRSALREVQERILNWEERLDLLRFQARELNELQPLPNEFFTISSEQQRLAYAQTVIAALQSVLEQLDDEGPVEGSLQQILGELESAERYDERLLPIHELIESARIQFREAKGMTLHLADQVEMNPQRQEELDERISQYLRLSRKHRCKPEELADLTVRINDEIASADTSAELLRERKEAVASAYSSSKLAADALTQARHTIAQRLSTEVTTAMNQLGMEGGCFSIQLDQRPGDPGEWGQDEVAFYVSTNPGMPRQPLSQVASGGELSRIGLALQVLASAEQSVTTLIFDEVDSGISGAVAEVVGTRLRELGSRYQVLCVTHLAQVAAQANHQFEIIKHFDGEQNRTQIQALDPDNRVKAIARLLGGTRLTPRTLAHAREMLNLPHLDVP